MTLVRLAFKRAKDGVEGPETEATIVGLIAVHPSPEFLHESEPGRQAVDSDAGIRARFPEWDGKLTYSLTHVPTGLGLGRWRFRSEEDALVVAVELQPLKWDELHVRSSRQVVADFGKMTHETINRLLAQGAIEQPLDTGD